MVKATSGGTVTLTTSDSARLATPDPIGGYANLLSNEGKDLDGIEMISKEIDLDGNIFISEDELEVN